MKPAPFSYALPRTLDEALELLHEYGSEARILAGGQSLAAMLNMRLATPKVLIDIAELPELQTISRRCNHVEIGAGVTQAELMAWPELADTQPLLTMILPHVGHYQTRQRGTICGSLAHSDPSSELPLALALLQGEVVLRSKRATRTVAASDFQTALMTTDVGDDEMVVACRFPVADGNRQFGFREITQRHGDFAIVAIAAHSTENGVRLAAGGVADVPAAIDWPRLSDRDLSDALNDFAWQLGGNDDVHATARYRRDLVRRIGRTIALEVIDAPA